MFRISWQLFICVPWQPVHGKSAISVATSRLVTNCPFEGTKVHISVNKTGKKSTCERAIIGFDHGLPYGVKNMARGTRPKAEGFVVTEGDHDQILQLNHTIYSMICIKQSVLHHILQTTNQNSLGISLGARVKVSYDNIVFLNMYLLVHDFEYETQITFIEFYERQANTMLSWISFSKSALIDGIVLLTTLLCVNCTYKPAHMKTENIMSLLYMCFTVVLYKYHHKLMYIFICVCLCVRPISNVYPAL